MSITNPLREWVEHIDENPHLGSLTTMGRAGLITIADIIDVLHKQAIDKAHADGERNGVRQQRGASEDYRRGYEAGKAELADGWVELPKDTDGVTWRIGDESEVGTIDCMVLREDGWSIDEGTNLFNPETMRHVQPDSWERIIKDAIRGDGGNYGCLEERFKATVPDLVARCKALAGEGE